MSDKSDSLISTGSEVNIEKKAYERPQVIYRAPLEAMAAVCAPAPPSKSNPGICPSGPISS
jgi:hypothetical protein